MIILAASVVITLSNTGIIDKASQAVSLTNESQVQDLAALLWTDAYMDNKRDGALVEDVKTKLEQQGITEDKWNINISNSGVTITKNPFEPGTLGYLIKGPEDYGKTVDYTVTANVTFSSYSGNAIKETTKSVTVSEWQVYYHNEDYVYLIAKEGIGVTVLNKGTTVASLTPDELALYEKFRVGNAEKYTLTDSYTSSKMVAQLIKDYACFANTDVYGTNVVGAIGGATVELFTAGWNAKGRTPIMTLTTNTYGYEINNTTTVDLTVDGIYVVSSSSIWLASPSNSMSNSLMVVNSRNVGSSNMQCDVRPVVCLKASIPATTGTTTDFSLVK